LGGADISIIVPCYNEELRITGLLNAIYSQTISLKRMEVIIADGLSEDNTRKVIEEFKINHPKLTIHLVDNPKRNIPAALNLAINKSSGKFIVRVDAHSLPEEHYVERCVTLLEADKADNVGGIWIIKPGNSSQTANAIAIAASHPLGVGGARYRDEKTQAGFVDTVPFGSYYRDFLLKIGLYDETLLSNEDYELNTRIREAKGKIFLDPSIQCIYFAREDYKALSKQYFRYGFWKFRMVKRYPGSLRLRQFLPPTFVLGMLGLLLTGMIFPLFITVFLLFMLFYLLSIFLGTFLVSNISNKKMNLHVLTTLAIITMHFSWGTGFLCSPIIGLLRSDDNVKNKQ